MKTKKIETVTKTLWTLFGFPTEHVFCEIWGYLEALETIAPASVMERPRQNFLYILLTANTLVSGRGDAQKERFLTDGRSSSPSFIFQRE